MNVQECVPTMRGSVRESVRELWSLAGNRAGSADGPRGWTTVLCARGVAGC